MENRISRHYTGELGPKFLQQLSTASALYFGVTVSLCPARVGC